MAGVAEAWSSYNHEREIACRDFWYFAQFVKTNDEENQSIRTFPVHYEYLHEMHHDFETHQKCIVLKSRRMLASWLQITRMMWRAYRTGCGYPDCEDIYHGAIMSIAEPAAVYQMDRIRFAWKLLPDWLKVYNPMDISNQMYIRFNRGGIIQAFPMQREGPHSYGFSEAFFDEMARQLAARLAWGGLIPTLGAKGKLVAVSTPNGMYNLFADIWHNKDNRHGDVHRTKLHWTRNPEHDINWYNSTIVSMSDQMVQQQMEMAFNVYLGQRVWDRYESRIHMLAQAPEINKYLPVLVGWDFGYLHPAVNVWQYNTRDQYTGFGSWLGTNEYFGDFVERFRQNRLAFYNPRQVPEIHFVDPAGFQRYSQIAKKSGAVSDIDEIRKQWRDTGPVKIYAGSQEVGTRSNEGYRLKSVRKLWPVRQGDGQPGILLSPQHMDSFIEGCAGGYTYPEEQSRSQSEQPVKNEYSHEQDAFQMVVTGRERVMGNRYSAKPKEVKKTPERIGRGGL